MTAGRLVLCVIVARPGVTTCNREPDRSAADPDVVTASGVPVADDVLLSGSGSDVVAPCAGDDLLLPR